MTLDTRRLASIALFLVLIIAWHTEVLAQPIGMLGKQAEQEDVQGILCSSGGRFVFGQISNSGKDQYMLDTATGRLWRISESGRAGLFLEKVPYKTESGGFSDLPPDAGESPQKKDGK